MPGLMFARRDRSVARRERSAVAAEAVVKAYGDHIHVLADPIKCTSNDGIHDRERVVRVTHEQMVVFKTDRPIRREAILETDTDGTTPARRTNRSQTDARQRREDIETIARHRRAALEVQERRIPGVTDLAGDEADAVNPGALREGWIDHADARRIEIRPI